jgi:glutamine amidotransferase
MCRLLLVSDHNGINPAIHLDAFKEISRSSKEFQGHGWGCAWLDSNSKWRLHHNILPVWEDQNSFPDTTLFLAHARSAFRDEGIMVENNMPFSDGSNIFLFNGELQGVKIRVDGRIGAEKIFNTIRRFDKGDLVEATHRAVSVINKRTRYIRAMNFFLANRDQILVYSQFGESPEYFQLNSLRAGDTRIICSQPYNFSDLPWDKIDNKQFETISLKEPLNRVMQ